MTVLPVPSIPPQTQRYINETPPAGLVVLQRLQRTYGPASEGNGLPPDTITPYSGIYGPDGKLPVPASNLTFLAHA